MNKKLKEFAKEHKKDMLIGAGVCVGCAVIYSVGYAVGYRDSLCKFANGLDIMWKVNPELKILMVNTLDEIEN